MCGVGASCCTTTAEPEVDDTCGLVEDDVVEETDADYRARMMHVDTFLRLNDSIANLQLIGEKNPECASEIQKALLADPEHVVDSSKPATSDTSAATVRLKTHAHLIYHGDLLQLSKETITLTITERDASLFARIIDCFKRIILGKHTDGDLARLRADHDRLIAMWDDAPPDETLDVGNEIKKMMRCMLETPLYFTNSCMALIACGQMLRTLYRESEGGPAETYDQLIGFVRNRMRHNPEDPFECECDGRSDDGVRCSEDCKTLMSMIMEVPTIVHNQTYLLQILAYLMFDKSGREEVFINNLKNTCSPGLLDKVPTRLAMLMGTLDEKKIRRHYKTIGKQLQHLNPLKDDRSVYSKNALDRLVQTVHDPRVQHLIYTLPGAAAAAVELRLPKCGALAGAGDSSKCLNKDSDEASIMTSAGNNNGRNKCCGYLRQDPFDILVSSISLAQLLVYSFTDPRTATAKSRQHFFVRDIIKSMARQTVKIKVDTLEEMFCYLDRTRVFKGFNEHPLMMAALQELFTSYIDYMKEAAEKYKETGKKRRVKRYLRRNGVPEGAAAT